MEHTEACSISLVSVISDCGSNNNDKHRTEISKAAARRHLSPIQLLHIFTYTSHNVAVEISQIHAHWGPLYQAKCKTESRSANHTTAAQQFTLRRVVEEL